MKRSAAILLCMVLLLTGCSRSGEDPRPTGETAVPQTETSAAATVPQTTEPQPERFLLTFVGDCTLGANPHLFGAPLGFPETMGGDYDYPFLNVESYFSQDDLTFANLECALTDTGFPVQKAHQFRGKEDYVRILTEHSVEAVSLSNNHSMDYGQEGYDNTRRALENAGVHYVEKDSTCLITTDRGLTVGLYGALYTYIDEEAMVEAISQLRDQADIVIFAPHWGYEKSPHPHEEQIRLAHAAIDAGADLVWGHHTHVLQDMEQYKDGLIFYSMGNFCFGGIVSFFDLDSAIWQQEFLKAPDGTVTLGETTIIPVRISSREDINNYQPTPYAVEDPGYQRVMDKIFGQQDSTLSPG